MTALRLPSHLGDPAAAWPRGARAALPGAPGFYASALWSLTARLRLCLPRSAGARRPRRVARPSAARARAPSARWASRGDLRPLRVPAPQPGRLTLGRSGRSLLAAEERQSVIVFAPTAEPQDHGPRDPGAARVAGAGAGDLGQERPAARHPRPPPALGEVMVFDPAAGDRDRALAGDAALGRRAAGAGAMRVAHWLAPARAGRRGRIAGRRLLVRRGREASGAAALRRRRQRPARWRRWCAGSTKAPRLSEAR